MNTPRLTDEEYRALLTLWYQVSSPASRADALANLLHSEAWTRGFRDTYDAHKNFDPEPTDAEG